MDFVFNAAKGMVRYYASLPGANDGLVVIPLEATGLEADTTLADRATLAALLAGSSNEQTTMGRKVVTPTVTVDSANDRVDIDMTDAVWTNPTGVDIGALLVCYDPDTTGGDDSTIIPLTKHDFPATVGIGDITAAVVAEGFVRIS